MIHAERSETPIAQPVPAGIVEQRVLIDGVATRTLAVAGDGPTLLLLHGFTDSADTWRPVLRELAGAGRRAVAIDLPGHGVAPPLELPLWDTLDRFVAGFVSRYADDQPAVLVGNSLGGLLAFRAASTDRLQIAAVAGLGPAGLAHTKGINTLTETVRRIHPLLFAVDRVPLPRSVVRRAALRAHHRLAESVVPELAEHYASHIRSVRDLARLRVDMLALANAVSAQGVVPADIRVPVLLIWGERDRLADLSGARLLLDAVPDSRLVVLDCGHLPQVQLPQQVASLLRELPWRPPR